MRLHVTYPGSGPHEVELLGRVSIVGRDPSCDLVIHDVKCSRRHAVLETGPDGVTVRDSGSANGIYLNGERVERTILRPGDVLTLGEVQIQLLPEPVEATMMASPENMATISPGHMEGLKPAAAPAAAAPAPAPVVLSTPPPPPPPPAAVVVAAPPAFVAAPPDGQDRPPVPGGGSYSISGSTDSGKLRAEAVKGEMAAMEAQAKAAELAAAGPGTRPLTVTLLAVLWLASVLLYLGNAVFAGIKMGGIPGIAVAVICAFLALVSAVMALGLWMVKRWAWILQLVIAGLGVFTCSFTLASAVTFFYLLRPGVRSRFNTGTGGGDPKEGLFAGLLLATVLLGAIAAGGGMYMASMRMAAAPPFPQP